MSITLSAARALSFGDLISVALPNGVSVGGYVTATPIDHDWQGVAVRLCSRPIHDVGAVTMIPSGASLLVIERAGSAGGVS